MSVSESTRSKKRRIEQVLKNTDTEHTVHDTQTQLLFYKDDRDSPRICKRLATEVLQASLSVENKSNGVDNIDEVDETETVTASNFIQPIPNYQCKLIEEKIDWDKRLYPRVFIWQWPGLPTTNTPVDDYVIKSFKKYNEKEISMLLLLKGSGVTLDIINAYACSYGDDAYFIMKRCKGLTLNQWIRYNKQLPPVRVWTMILDAIRSLHSFEIVHYDLHDQNIMLDVDDAKSTVKQAYIIDFGNSYTTKLQASPPLFDVDYHRVKDEIKVWCEASESILWTPVQVKQYISDGHTYDEYMVYKSGTIDNKSLLIGSTKLLEYKVELFALCDRYMMLESNERM